MERVESEPRRTVVHLVPAMEQGGVETVVLNLNRALVRAGWRSVVVSKGGRLVGRVLADGGEHVALDLKSKNPLTAFVRAWKLRRVLRQVAASLVCAHSRVPAWLFVLARRLDSIIRLFDYSIISPSRSPFPVPRSPSPNSIIRLFDYSIISSLPFITYAHGANSVSRYSAVMTKGDRVIVPSRFLADFLVANYAKPSKPSKPPELPSRLRVIYPAVDFERFDPAKVDAAKVAALRRAWGLAAGDVVVMAVGRLTPLKGFDHLIRDLAGQIDVTPDAAWGDVLRAPRTKLVIVGGADRRHLAYEAELKALAASLGVADRVVFAGTRDCIPECLSLADVVVSGNVTKPESFGLSVAEALAMGKPVRLLRRFGGAAEILDEVEKKVEVEGKVEVEAPGGERKVNRPFSTSTSGLHLKYREGVRALCDFDIMSRKTQAVYEELVK